MANTQYENTPIEIETSLRKDKIINYYKLLSQKYWESKGQNVGRGRVLTTSMKGHVYTIFYNHDVQGDLRV